jgi:hypothetical protein
MLQDNNYVFWQGRIFPIKIIVICVVVVLASIIVCVLLHRRAPRKKLNYITMAVTVASFTALLGVSLVLTSLPASSNIFNTAGRISAGCSNPLLDSEVLVDYSQVLYNIRKTPACVGKESVDECDGWKENRYTDYLRYMEKEFLCGPLCPSMVPFAAPVAAAPPAVLLEDKTEVPAEKPQRLLRRRSDDRNTREAMLLETDREEQQHRRNKTHATNSALLRVAEEKSQQLPVGIVMNGPPATQKLFSLGVTRMECYPLVATRLRVLAWYSNDLTFWEGFGLICVSVVTSFVAFLSMCFGTHEAPTAKHKPGRMFS